MDFLFSFGEQEKYDILLKGSFIVLVDVFYLRISAVIPYFYESWHLVISARNQFIFWLLLLLLMACVEMCVWNRWKGGLCFYSMNTFHDAYLYQSL